ncbi:unnamed protein product [Closterium sp. Yama58-4]|nr:unnamed protein product [Closterium sp. Yama58-4]
MSKVLIAEGLGYNLLSVSQLMAKRIQLEADSTTQNSSCTTGEVVFISGRRSSRTTSSLGGFWHSHTIPEAERTRASAAAEITSAAAETTSAAADITSAAAEITSAAAETTSAAAETTSAAAETTSAAAETTSTAAETTTAAAETNVNTSRWSLNGTALHQRHVTDTRTATQTGTTRSPPKRQPDLPHQPFPSHHNPGAPVYAPLEKVYSDILYNRAPGQNAYNYTITFIDAATRYVWHLNLPSRDMAFEAFIAWLPEAERESGAKLKSFQPDGEGSTPHRGSSSTWQKEGSRDSSLFPTPINSKV